MCKHFSVGMEGRREPSTFVRHDLAFECPMSSYGIQSYLVEAI